MPPHDQLAKELLRTFLADLLHLVDPRLAAELRPEAAVFLDKELFTDSPAGQRREIDFLVKVPPRSGRGRPVLFHVEVEATARKGMGRRLWHYFNLIQGRHALPVLAVVINLRKGRPGLHRERLEVSIRGRRVATFHYAALGLAGCRAGDYLDRLEPLAWAFAALMRRGRRSRAELKLACLRRIAQADLAELPRFVLVNWVETYLQLTPGEAAEYDALRALEENQEVQAMQQTWAEKLEAKGVAKGRAEGQAAGRAEGKAEGQAEGRAEGKAQGAREILLRQLRQRFGTLPAEAERRIQEVSSLERLTRLADQVLVARSLEEMGLA
jgi:uncharacterized protein DUF4351